MPTRMRSGSAANDRRQRGFLLWVWRAVLGVRHAYLRIALPEQARGAATPVRRRQGTALYRFDEQGHEIRALFRLSGKAVR